MSPVSVVRRTRWLMVAVAALSVAVVFVVFYLAWTAYTVRLRTDDLSRQTRVIARGLEASASEPADELRQRLFRIEAGLIGATLSLTDSDGGVTMSSRESADDIGRSYPLDRLGEPDADGVSSAVLDVEGSGRVLLVAVPWSADGDQGYLVAVQPLREVNRTRGWVVLLLTASAAFAIVVALVAGGWSARRLTGPVVRLQQASEAIAAGEWGHQAPVEGDDEVASLATAFNDMSRRVASAYRAQQDFVGNVSHELRTPITTIAGFAAAIEDGVVEGEPAQRYVGIIRSEAERLGELSRVLLALADLDAGVVDATFEPLEARRLAASLRDRHGPGAADKGIELDLDALQGDFRGDERLLLQALSTLVENAVRYTPDDGAVHVSLQSEGDSVRLVVEDSGPGIPSGRRDEVFGRFVRLDPSRSQEGGGSGLGLAICRHIVETLGGRVWVEASELGGARFVIDLPQGR